MYKKKMKLEGRKGKPMGDWTGLRSIWKETRLMQQSLKEGTSKSYSQPMLVLQDNWPSTPAQG
jgi:hypothetical protein